MQESIFGSLSSILDTRRNSLDNEKPYYHEDDLSALFDGLNFYRDYKEFSVSYGKDSVIGTVTNADGTSYTASCPTRSRLRATPIRSPYPIKTVTAKLSAATSTFWAAV